MPSERPEIPVADFRSAAGDAPETHQAIDDFHAAYTHATPNSASIEEHAGRLRSHPALVGAFERWYLHPRVQAFIAELTATGI